MTLSRQQMRGAPEPSTVDPDADTVVDGLPPASEPDEVKEPEDDGKIPDEFVEGPGGSWVYTLRFPLRPTKDDPDGADCRKIRLPAHVYVDDLMKAAAKNPQTAFEELVYTLAAVTGVGDAVFRRLSEQDFRAISSAYSLRRRRAAAHPT